MEKIFIVEDDKSLNSLYKKILKLNGFEVVGIAEDGEEAISMFKAFKHKPQVILMDHHLPKKNGMEASKEILQIDPKINIIFITGDKSVKGEAFACGAFSFLEKPLTIKLLIQTIKRAMKNYKLHNYISH